MRRTSGRARASHHSTLSRRAFSELTFQVAIRTDPRLPRAGPPWLVLRAARLTPPGAEGPHRGTAAAGVASALARFSTSDRLRSFAGGAVHTADVGFFVAVAAGALVLAATAVDSRRLR